MKTLRTPDDRFEDLPGYPYAPHYLELDDLDGGSLRVHYVDEGARDATPVILLHGEPTWCSYCKAFMPYLARIQSDYGTEKISVVAVNAKQARAKDGDPKAYVDALGFPMTAVRDGDAIAAAYNVKFIPGLMVIDGNGVVAYRRRSTDLPAGKTVAELWSDEVREALDKLGSE